MSRKKPGLGKGLDALIPRGDEAQFAQPERGGLEIEIDLIKPNPRQPRTLFDPESISELAESINKHGVIQPIILSQNSETRDYILVAGERRLIAAKEAGLEKIPVVIREISDQGMVEIALIENVQRADLSPLERAGAYAQLVDDFGLSHEAIAQSVGKSRVSITNTLRLLNLPPSVQEAINNGKISEGHARALLGLATPQSQTGALQTIIKDQLSVRQTEILVRRLSAYRPTPKPKPGKPPELIDLEARLRNRLGTRVTVNPGRVGGSITITYYSDEELDAILAIFLPEE